MAREIVLARESGISRFALSKVDRAKLYGRKTRMVVDDEGEPCVAAMLTRDGTALLPPGSVASLYIDDAGDVVSRSDLNATDSDGNALDDVASTLGVAQPLTGPVDPREVLDCLISSVYQLDPTEAQEPDADSSLLDALNEGQIFRSTFAYRSGHSDSTLFLLGNDEGIFALVGNHVPVEPVTRPQAVAEVFDDEEDDDLGELDFGMM